jgi:fatty acid desaturase
MSVKIKYKIILAIYPMIEIILFGLACYTLKTNVFYAILLTILSALFLSFSLHITSHFHVHHKPISQVQTRILDYFYTLILGMSFHFYQVQHYIHHKYDNKIGDFTSTFEIKDDKKNSRSLFSYAFFWFLGFVKIKQLLGLAESYGFYNEKIKKKINQESFLNLIVILLLIYLNFGLVFLYLLLIYFGWVFIAIHNFGQHLPETVQSVNVYSFYGKWYYFLFFFIGLHFEHHHNPSVYYWDLVENKQEERINRWAHLLDPIRFIMKNKS